jgi:ribosomal protein S18 acetylase RimI-like enzyme
MSAGEAVVRPYEPGDEAGIVALWSEDFAGGPPYNEPRVALARKLALADGLVFVASADNRIVGTTLGGYDGVRGWIYHVLVAPSERRQGLGTRLMRATEQALAERGCPKVNLQVRGTNGAVVAFYAKLGYAEEDRVSLGKPLAAET